MTDREKAIVMAYTGVTMLTDDKFRIFHQYVEDIMGRPVMTHELGSAAMVKEIKARTMEDFMALCADEKSGWVPANERLPKAGEYIGDVAKYYLVQNEYGDMMVAKYTHSEYWEQIYQLKPIGDEIVAWRELPPLYNPESEDKE